MNINIDSIPDMIAYLQTVHITRLSTAARMAGFKFKNGEFNKAGIIENLAYTPSKMRATIAVLGNMERGEPPVSPAPVRNPFADDIAEETSPIFSPVAPIPPPVAVVPGFDLSEYLKKTEWKLSREEDKTDINNRLESALRLRDIAIEACKAKISELEKKTPVQLIINNNLLPVISGQHPRFVDLIEYLQINRRVILTGSAGTGKSMAVKKAAEILGMDFYLQTPITQSHELLGYRDANGVFHESPLFKAYTRGGLILMDEADASLSDALLCANPIFDGNGFAMFGDGNMHAQHSDFMVVFNMNTDGNGATIAYPGRQPLDGATLARFGVRIHWSVSPEIEENMSGGFLLWLAAVRAVRTLMDARRIIQVNATPRHVKTGAVLLAARPSRDKRAMLIDILKSGAIADCWGEVENLPAVRTFLAS